jgi:hypothetical protein
MKRRVGASTVASLAQHPLTVRAAKQRQRDDIHK